MRMPKIDKPALPEASGTRYPAPFDQPCKQRRWRRLGEAAGLSQFGVNLLRLAPGVWSAQRHWHSHEDEFVYVLEGEVVLVTDEGEETLQAETVQDSRPAFEMGIACRTDRCATPNCW